MVVRTEKRDQNNLQTLNRNIQASMDTEAPWQDWEAILKSPMFLHYPGSRDTDYLCFELFQDCFYSEQFGRY